ncbi:MAG: hypothetical protein QNL74_01545 [Rhodobacter sp.]|jgi:hypothetical protein|nr:MAG: hypothetical protein ABR89_08720 [Rhodobacter sp. BACL10 MAG-120910-bin24]NQV67742.1 hypothetical protein [Paracoccaceae bacterium]
MFNSLFNSIIAAQQASAAAKVLAYISDTQLAEIGHTRATFIENVKTDFINSLQVETAAIQNKTPVNANLAGVF